MNALEESLIYCPYCGEPSTILIDCSPGDQSYYEDCQVCCKPIAIEISLTNTGTYEVRAASENDA